MFTTKGYTVCLRRALKISATGKISMGVELLIYHVSVPNHWHLLHCDKKEDLITSSSQHDFSFGEIPSSVYVSCTKSNHNVIVFSNISKALASHCSINEDTFEV